MMNKMHVNFKHLHFVRYHKFGLFIIVFPFHTHWTHVSARTLCFSSAEALQTRLV